ncbi:hypothetical protein KEM60_02073 [Austwickia sp. TVS 96-490-7B]|nr:hypothetical protein [Austwickia sp. TVS 96-490-7B]
MTVRVHANDRSHFHRGQHGIASKAADNASGRFHELGGAHSCNTHGVVERTVTWNIHDPAPAAVNISPEADHRGRGDRVDRGPLWPNNSPRNQYETGKARLP